MQARSMAEIMATNDAKAQNSMTFIISIGSDPFISLGSGGRADGRRHRRYNPRSPNYSTTALENHALRLIG